MMSAASSARATNRSMVSLALLLRNQVFFHVAIAALAHLLPVCIGSIVATAVTWYQAGNGSLVRRLDGFPRLFRLGRSELIIDIDANVVVSSQVGAGAGDNLLCMRASGGANIHDGLACTRLNANVSAIINVCLVWACRISGYAKRYSGSQKSCQQN